VRRPPLPRPSQWAHDKCAAHLGAAHRPTKLTADVQARIVQAIEAGNYLDVAARYGGIAPSTLHAWVQRGRDDAVARAPQRVSRAPGGGHACGRASRGSCRRDPSTGRR